MNMKSSLFLATLVSCHGFLIQPLGLNGQTAARVSAANPCGAGVNMDSITPEQLAAAETVLRPGDTVTMTYVIQNGDGAGPLTVELGQPGQLQEVTVTQQVPGNNGILQNPRPNRDPFPFSFVVPENLNCATGCMVRVTQPRNFGACALVRTGDATSIPPPAAIQGAKGAKGKGAKGKAKNQAKGAKGKAKANQAKGAKKQGKKQAKKAANQEDQ
jgi:hypothetical protein